MKTNSHFFSQDWQAEEQPATKLVGSGDVRSVMCVPLSRGDGILGAISLQRSEPGQYQQSDLQVLRAIADDVSIVIQNANLYANTQELVDKGTHDYQTAVALRQAIAIISTSLDEGGCGRQAAVGAGQCGDL